VTRDSHTDAGARRIIFWRHGRTEWNRIGRFQGQEDIQLDETGRRQAERAAVVLAAREPSMIVASDLRRAADTAMALSRRSGVGVTLDRRLRETDAGQWQGLSFAEITERFTEDNEAWRGGDPEVRAGGAESRLDVGRRMVDAVLDVVGQVEPSGTLVVVSHGGAIRAALAALIGLPPDHWGALAGLSNCHWSELHEVTERRGARFAWQLTEHNVGFGSVPTELLEG
jgi:broad specificity phosphatase PhoE